MLGVGVTFAAAMSLTHPVHGALEFSVLKFLVLGLGGGVHASSDLTQALQLCGSKDGTCVSVPPRFSSAARTGISAS